jgi:hypothetical protein
VNLWEILGTVLAGLIVAAILGGWGSLRRLRRERIEEKDREVKDRERNDEEIGAFVIDLPPTTPRELP